LIDNEIELATTDFLTAAKGDIGDAGFFLGLVYLQSGKVNTALKLFRFADIKNTTIIDNAAALSQIYLFKKQNALSETYSKLYKSKLPENLVITPTPVPLHEIKEQNEISEAIPYIDSILALHKNIIDTALVDTLSQDSIAVDTNAINTIPKEKEISIWEKEDWLLLKYAVGIGLAAILFVIYLYLK
jgi:hypothetical protein